MKRTYARVLATLTATAGLGLFAAPVQAKPVSTVGPGSTVNPHDVMHLMTLTGPMPAAISHTLFLNRCAGGCTVTYGNPDSRTDHSDIGQGQLTAFNGGDAEWNQVVSCVKGVMAPFNITVTDQDPGNVDHFEVMIAGSGSEIGEPTGVLGVADFLCQSPGQCGQGYIPNALVFDFANDWPQYGGGVTEICGTAAQEIAHAWSLDHTTVASDPMTYKNYQAPLHYQNGAPCGSDCQSGYSPFNLPCSGSGMNATHTCMSSGQATQNEVDQIMGLFGSNAPDTTPPTVQITSPTDGAQVQPGFPVRANLSDDVAVSKAELRIDGNLVGSALTGAPWVWNAPMTLAPGSHHVEVTGYDAAGNTAKDAVDVTYGSMCSGDSDCGSGQVCSQGVCVNGPGMQGGLGSTCTQNSDCDTGQCASDGKSMYCVSNCDPMNSSCPGGFGCVATGASSGVCWPGADSGSGGGHGGCDAGGGGGSSGLPIVLGLTFAALVFTRRRS